jgi:hypothetical protein
MSTNKECIESLEAGFGGLQDGMHRMELGMVDKFSQLEATLNRISEMFFPIKKAPTTTLIARRTFTFSQR